MPNNDTVTATFPTIEAALAALGQKVLGASIVIAAAPPADLNPACPPLEPGWLFYGKGPLKHRGRRGGDDDVAMLEFAEWKYTSWEGCRSDRYYAIRAGTELARLNGLEPDVAPAPEYRLLEEGEEILITDEWQDNNGKWHRRASVKGDEKLNLTENGGHNTPHRRRVEPQPEPTPEVVRVLSAQVRNIAIERDKHRHNAETLEAETERLHTLWHGAAEDAQAQRDEVKRLAERIDMLHAENSMKAAEIDNLQVGVAHLRCKLVNLRNSEAIYKDRMEDYEERAKTLSAKVREVEAGRKHYIDAWGAAATTIAEVTKERNALHALHAHVAELEAQRYRDLEHEEIIFSGDEQRHINGEEAWTQVKSSSVGLPFRNPFVRVRRPLKPN